MRYLITLAVLLIGITALATEVNKEAIATREVTAYINHWSRDLAGRHRRRAMRFVPNVARWSVYYDVDPLLVAVTITMESAWKPRVRGPVGEIGLTQVHSREAKRGFKLWIPDQQIRAGAKWLRRCLDTCGSTRRAVAMYASGSCSANWPGLNKRMRAYRRAVRMFRK